MSEELARQIGTMVGGVLVVALLFELLDAKSGDIKTWVKGRLDDTTFINKVNTVVENTITKLFSKADQYALFNKFCSAPVSRFMVTKMNCRTNLSVAVL